jgi:hypothetical protein
VSRLFTELDVTNRVQIAILVHDPTPPDAYRHSRDEMTSDGRVHVEPEPTDGTCVTRG